QAEDGIRDRNVTGDQTCALPNLKQKIKTTRNVRTKKIKILMKIRKKIKMEKILRILKIRKKIRRKKLLNQFLMKISRSEEHTSELQSRFDLVCRLLLEKKKKKKK